MLPPSCANIALGDVRVLVLLSMCHPRIGAGEQPHPTWTQMAHSSTVRGWLGVVTTPAATFWWWTGGRRRAGTATPAALATRASGRHEGKPFARPRGRIVPALARARGPVSLNTDPGDRTGNHPGLPVSGTTHDAYASGAQRPRAPAAIPGGALPHACPPTRLSLTATIPPH